MSNCGAAVLEIDGTKEGLQAPALDEQSNSQHSPKSSTLMTGRLETVKEVTVTDTPNESTGGDYLVVVVDDSASKSQPSPTGGRLEVVKECASDDTIRAEDLCTCNDKKDSETEKLVPDGSPPRFSQQQLAAKSSAAQDDSGGTSAPPMLYSIMKKKPRSFSLDYGRVNYLSNEPPSDYLARSRRKVSIISTDSERCQNCGNYTASMQSDLDLQKPGVKFLDEMDHDKNAQYYNQSKPRKYMAAFLAAGCFLIFILIIVVVLVVLSKSKKS